MTLTLELSPSLETRLAQEASLQGLPVEKYAVRVLELSRPISIRREDLAAELQRGLMPVRRNRPTTTCCNNLTRIEPRIARCIRPS